MPNLSLNPPMAVQLQRRWRVWVLCIAVFVLFFQLGGRGLNELDEGRYSEGGREMLASGDYLTPRLNGVPHFAKPPLTYWAIASSMGVFGVNEFGARFPAALSALATLLAVYLIGRRALGEAGALWAVVVLLTSVLFLGVARLITTDMILTCWVTWSVWALWRWHDLPSRRWRDLVPFYVFLGLGILTKGPVAVVLPLFAAAGLHWRNPGFHLLRMGWLRGSLIILAIALPWFVVVTSRNPGLLGYFLGREVAGRVLSDVHGRGEVWWYFLPVLAGGLLPWTPWLAMVPLVRRGLPEREAHLLRMCAVWAGAGLLLFTLSRSKLPTYMVPLLPPLALITVMTLIRLPLMLKPEGMARVRRCCGGISALVLIGAGVFMLVTGPRKYDLPLSLALIPLVVAVVTTGVALVVMERRGLLPGVGMLALAVLAVAVSLFSLIPHVETRLGSKTPAKFIAARILAEDPRQESVVLMHGNLPLGLPFYLQRPVLWYRPPTESIKAAAASGFEYRDAANLADTVLDKPSKLQTLLEGPSRVFCVADKQNASDLIKQYGLHELANDSRRVLLVNSKQ
jgi:4-amino-4-deoxy-L-arabinose transferase-like glycosyltransferase